MRAPRRWAQSRLPLLLLGLRWNTNRSAQAPVSPVVRAHRVGKCRRFDLGAVGEDHLQPASEVIDGISQEFDDAGEAVMNLEDAARSARCEVKRDIVEDLGLTSFGIRGREPKEDELEEQQIAAALLSC